MTTAVIVSTATLSSDQASDRVRGIYQNPFTWRTWRSALRQECLQIRVLRVPQCVGISFEHEPAVAEHQKLRFALLALIRGDDSDLVVLANRAMRRDVERIPQLVSDEQ